MAKNTTPAKTPTTSIARSLRGLGLDQGSDFRVKGLYVGGERTGTYAVLYSRAANVLVAEHADRIERETEAAGFAFHVSLTYSEKGAVFADISNFGERTREDAPAGTVVVDLLADAAAELDAVAAEAPAAPVAEAEGALPWSPMAELIKGKSCCVCGSKSVAYANYRHQVFCFPCSEGQAPAAPVAEAETAARLAGAGTLVVGGVCWVPLGDGTGWTHTPAPGSDPYTVRWHGREPGTVHPSGYWLTGPLVDGGKLGAYLGKFELLVTANEVMADLPIIGRSYRVTTVSYRLGRRENIVLTATVIGLIKDFTDPWTQQRHPVGVRFRVVDGDTLVTSYHSGSVADFTNTWIKN